MGYGLILLIASITLVVVFVCLTEARPATKAIAAVALLFSLLAPRYWPVLTSGCIALQATLSIVIIVDLKLQGFVR